MADDEIKSRFEQLCYMTLKIRSDHSQYEYLALKGSKSSR